jgi:hypothetical protein
LKPVTIKQLREELKTRSHDDLQALCLRLARFKKENKELLTYILYDSTDEKAYIRDVKREIDEQFDLVNRSSYYFIKKSVRKILRTIKKYIRYSGKKETEVELLIYFCLKLKNFKPSISNNVALTNLYHRQLYAIRQSMKPLHEDLQYDYQTELDKLML